MQYVYLGEWKQAVEISNACFPNSHPETRDACSRAARQDATV
jgi:hypothetical protein